MSEWIELNGIEDVARAKVEGWEIEVQTDAGNDKYCPWKLWSGAHWNAGYLFRGRPKQPQEMVIPCFFTGNGLTWSLVSPPEWLRIPELDKKVKVTK
jgi:hypothetical protein